MKITQAAWMFLILLISLPMTFCQATTHSAPSAEVSNSEKAVAHAEYYHFILSEQFATLKKLKASPKIDKKLRLRVDKVLPIIPGTLKKLDRIIQTSKKKNLSAQSFTATRRDIYEVVGGPLQESHEIIGIAGEMYSINCSREVDRVRKACQAAIRARSNCGAYRGQYGKEFRQQDEAACEALIQLVLLRCRLGSNMDINQVIYNIQRETAYACGNLELLDK